MPIHFEESQTFKGTSAARGTRDTRLSRVVRHGVLSGLDDTIQSYHDALDFAQNHYASFDPIEGLPRQRIRVVKMSGSRALVVVEYQRTPNLPDFDNLNAMERASSSPGKESIPWFSRYNTYSSGNYPATNWAETNTSGSNTRTKHDITTIKFVAVMVYGSSPLSSSILNMQNKVNGSTFDLGGIAWAQHTVRFDGADITPERIGAYTIHNVKWHFTACKERFFREHNNNDQNITASQMYDSVAISIPTSWTP